MLGEQAQDHLTKDLYLPRRSVARVHLDGGVLDPAGEGCAVGGDVGLEVAQDSGRRLGAQTRFGQDTPVGGADRQQHALGLAHVPTHGGQQRVGHPEVGVVVPTPDGRSRVAQGLPERLGGMRHPQVHVAVLAQGAEQLGLGHAQPGVPEQGQSSRKRQLQRASPQALHGTGVAYDGAGVADLLQQVPPQGRLPLEVVLELPTGTVAAAAALPVEEQLRPLQGVRREQAGQPTCHGVAPPTTESALLLVIDPVTEVLAQDLGPLLAGDPVDHPKQWPGQLVGGPDVVVLRLEDLAHQAGG